MTTPERIESLALQPALQEAADALLAAARSSSGRFDDDVSIVLLRWQQ